MDVSAPYRAIAPTLDVAVLVELSRMPAPVSVSTLRGRVGRGSDRGLRLALDRLVRQGIVRRRHVGPLSLFELNHDHVAAPVARMLADLRSRFLQQLRELIAGWEIRPLHASLFGSAARRDGNAESDIDLFVVRPPDVDEDDERWRHQLDTLEERVRAWTGNPVQISELGARDLTRLRGERPAIVEELERDAIELAGSSVRRILDRAASR